MINLLLGAPGGGKSYEACVYHILPALLKGRKVITNLPLTVEAFERIEPSLGALIEIRTKTLKPPPGEGEVEQPQSQEAGGLRAMLRSAREARYVSRAFANVEDYADPWRHPEQGFGPLYVIDECHFCMPAGETPRAVEEWYSMHRHFNVDALLITQSYGKISHAVRDLVQMVYRVRKNVAFGSTGSYTRKVQDGLRGEIVNTTIRTYQKKHFGLYRSHTQGSAVQEFNASDVRPLWKHWTFMGAALCMLLVLGIILSGKVHMPWATAHARPAVAGAAATPRRSSVAPASPSSRSCHRRRFPRCVFGGCRRRAGVSSLRPGALC